MLTSQVEGLQTFFSDIHGHRAGEDEWADFSISAAPKAENLTTSPGSPIRFALISPQFSD